MLLLVYFIPFYLFCHQTDAIESVNWYEPPPVGAVSNAAEDLSHDIRLREGSSNEPLRWKFSLTELTLASLTLRFNGATAASIIPGRLSGVDAAYTSRFSLSWIPNNVTLNILTVTAADEGVFRCELLVASGAGSKTWKRSIRVTVVVPPKFFNNVSAVERSVKERSDLNLYCGASGKPPSNITWIRVFENGGESQVLHTGATWNILNINKTDAGEYRCTANNGVGSSVSHTITVNVLSLPKIVNFTQEYKVAVQQSVTLRCQAEGYPEPRFTWSPCSNNCNTSSLTIPEVLNDTVYTCTATNSEGSDSAATTIVIAAKDINITMSIKDGDCFDKRYNKSSLSTALSVTMRGVFANESGYLSTTVNKVSCGSVIVDLTLSFNTTVTEKRILNILKEAAKDGKLGDFNVDASSIKGARPKVPVTTRPDTGKTTPKPPDDDYVTIIIAVVVSVAVLAIIGVAVFYVYKKKKDKKNDNKGKRTDGNARVIVPWKPNRQEKVTA